MTQDYDKMVRDAQKLDSYERMIDGWKRFIKQKAGAQKVDYTLAITNAFFVGTNMAFENYGFCAFNAAATLFCTYMGATEGRYINGAESEISKLEEQKKGLEGRLGGK
ncbi:MAG: hypothetical protein V1734_02725 [Nanoarchaeota archaeon]